MVLLIIKFQHVKPLREKNVFKRWKGRILGGKNVVPGQFSQHATLRTAQKVLFCGGSIHNNRLSPPRTAYNAKTNICTLL